jgi:hypothetical protein
MKLSALSWQLSGTSRRRIWLEAESRELTATSVGSGIEKSDAKEKGGRVQNPSPDFFVPAS